MLDPNAGNFRFGQKASAVVVKAAARPRAKDRTIKMKRVPLRVEMPKGANGIMYPDFDQIASGLRKGLTWTEYFEVCGGWFYDKLSGHDQTDTYNPNPETWMGAVLVDAAFADEAMRLFPARCKVLTEVEFLEFHDDRCTIQQPLEHINADRLLQIRAKYGILEGILSKDDARITALEDKQALDPEHPAPGIVRNRRKKLADVKIQRNLEIDEESVISIRGRR